MITYTLISLDANIKSEQIKNIDNYIINSLSKNIEENKNNNDINNNEDLIKDLLTEVRELSNKQISLLDLMDDLQTNT